MVLATRKLWLLALALFLGMGFIIGACGGAAEEVPGVTSDEIVLGTHTSLTGPIAVYSQIPNSTKAYFDFINDTKGGVNGRKITFLLEDDAYSPPKAVDLVRKLVEQDQIFALLNGLGTVLTFKLDGALHGFIYSGDAVEDRRFAGAVGSNYREYLALFDREADAVEGQDASEANRKVFYC